MTVIRRSSVLTSIVLATSALILAACGSGASGSSGPNAAPSTVRVELCNGRSVSWLPYLIAEADGDIAKIEAKYHTKFVDVTNITGANCVPAFTSGSVDFFGSTLANDALAMKSLPDTRAILEPFHGVALYFVGAKQYEASRGTDPAKYNGSKIGATAQGTPTSTTINLLAQKYHFSYNEVDVGLVTAFTPSLQQGRLDAFMGEVTAATKALSTGAGYMIQNLNTAQVDDLVGKFIGLNYAASKSFTDKYPGLTQDFVQAQIRSLSLIKAAGDDPAKIAALTPADLPDTHSPSWPITWSLIRDANQLAPGGITQQAFNDSARSFVETGPLKPGDTVSGSLVNNSFVINAYKNLGLTPPVSLPSEVTDAR
jgi:ABC-type nitrate/sulfonate/bicarbonate transport system substrate-binding protein